MNDPVSVRVAYRLANGFKNGQQPAAIGRWIGPRLQDDFQGAPLDELHGQEGPAIGESTDLVHRRDTKVLQLPRNPRPAEESLGGQRIDCVVLGQQLDGDLAVEGSVAGAVDYAHAAAVDLVNQFQFVARLAGRRSARLDDGGLRP
jgi:hypothetical protein